jgi:hypothetical protein
VYLLSFLETVKEKLRNTMREVSLNIEHGKIAVERRSVLSQMGMIYLKKGKSMGFKDIEVDDMAKKVSVLSSEINKIAREMKIKEEVDFTQMKTENAINDKFNELMMRITTSTEKMELRSKYDELVDKGMEALAALGFMVMTANHKEFETLPEFQDAKRDYDAIHKEYLSKGQEIQEFQVLAKDRSEFLIPMLTFLCSLKDYAKTKKPILKKPEG